MTLRKAENTWEPNANTRAILITTTPGGRTENLTFRDITSDGVAGAVVTVLGAEQKGSEREVETFARNVTVENCTLERSGKFMWDYGYLWQITVWPEDYNEAERAMAAKYFRHDLVRGPLRHGSGRRSRVVRQREATSRVANREGADASRGHDAVCFFGDTLPSNIVRGRQYFVVESKPDFIRIAETPGGRRDPFRRQRGAASATRQPAISRAPRPLRPGGQRAGQGGLRPGRLRESDRARLPAQRPRRYHAHPEEPRDRLRQQSHHRLAHGGFFLAEFCQDATVTGNTVDGSNGSRVVSVEKSCEDVTIIGNTFRNGGRGSWINQPRNFVLSDNVFVNNTTKCERDPRRGRRSFVTGDYERYAELYFTTYEPGGRYGNVIIRGNIFMSGPHAEHAITFAPGGDTILVTDNVFSGPVRDIAPIVGCENVTIRGNVGAVEGP